MYEMTLQGYNLLQAIEKIGICYNTYNLNKKEFETTIKEAIKLREIRELTQTKNALRKKIEGFEIEEKTYKTKIDEEGNEIEYLYERKVKQVLPDTTAIIFELVNKSEGEYISINNTKETTNYIPTTINIS
jgi:hypothetical protein